MQIDSISTLVLRYRDLSSKNTIELHDNIITKKGFVWWGWWAKPQEKVALEVISKMETASKSKEHLKIYLLDSGKIELREATCTEIRFDVTGMAIPSPSKSATPKYYSQSEYMIWFKLTEISKPIPKPDSFINNYSYVKVDDHFASGESPFAAFDNKKVYDLEELVEQQCTIWYLREASESDEHRRIVSYSPGTGEYDNSFMIANSNKLLWLSDVHFSTNHHAFKTKPGSNNTLFNVLNQRLSTIKCTKFSKVIVSGDFAFKAETSEFEMAYDFFNKLSSCYAIDGPSYIFCPGNHDMQYSENDYADDDPVVLAYPKAKKNYIDFYEKVRETKANEYANTIQRFVTSNGVLVEIIALNTCILQQDSKHFRGMGFAGNDQLVDLEKTLKKTERMNSVRILTMHHHLLPVLFAQEPIVNPMYSMLLDSEAISQFCLRNKIGIILHGHTHINYYAELSREKKDGTKKTIHVFGLGSTGAIRDDLTIGSHNQFATLTFDPESLKIQFYNIFPDASESEENPFREYIVNYGAIK